MVSSFSWCHLLFVVTTTTDTYWQGWCYWTATRSIYTETEQRKPVNEIASPQDACSENKKRITAYGPHFSVWMPDTHAICLIHCFCSCYYNWCNMSWMMMITKNSCDVSHRGVKIESQNNKKPSANPQKSMFKHLGGTDFPSIGKFTTP